MPGAEIDDCVCDGGLGLCAEEGLSDDPGAEDVTGEEVGEVGVTGGD